MLSRNLQLQLGSYFPLICEMSAAINTLFGRQPGITSSVEYMRIITNSATTTDFKSGVVPDRIRKDSAWHSYPGMRRFWQFRLLVKHIFERKFLRSSRGKTLGTSS